MVPVGRLSPDLTPVRHGLCLKDMHGNWATSTCHVQERSWKWHSRTRYQTLSCCPEPTCPQSTPCWWTIKVDGEAILRMCQMIASWRSCFTANYQRGSTNMVVTENTSKTPSRPLWQPLILTQLPGNMESWTAPLDETTPSKGQLLLRRRAQLRQEESAFSERKELQSLPPRQLLLPVPPVTSPCTPRLEFSVISGYTKNRLRMSVIFVACDGHILSLSVTVFKIDIS